MLTSQEIAEQIAQQNQFFQGQSAMASQIGVSPFYGGGGGGYGMPSPFGAGRAPMAPPMAPPAGGGFSYGGGMFSGYGFGNRAGAFAGAAMGAAPFAMTTGLELASMTGWGRGLAPFVNPVSAFGMGRSMGMGFAGSTAMAGAAMLPAAALMHMGTSMAGGAMQQSQVGTALSGYNFINPQARSGQGFSRGDISNITSQVRQLAYLPELLTSFDELSRIMPRLQQAGAMQGVRDAGEFNRRFKEAIGTVREISKMIGTTMEEASEFFAHSRRVGFLGRDQQIRNAVNAQVTMATTGMTQQQVMQLQQTGADFATAVGAPRALGAAATTNLATQLGFAQQSGTIRAGALEDLTGQQGAAAVQAGAVQLANAAVRLAGTSTGQYMLAGAIDMDENGRVSLNRQVMEGLAGGNVDAAQLRRRGARLMGNRRFATAFKANQGRLAMDFAGQGGAQGFYSLIAGELERYGYGDDENATRLVLQQQGIGEQESEIIAKLARQSAMGTGGQQQALERIRRQQAGMREQYSPGAIWKRLTTKVGAAITQPFEELGQRASAAVGRTFDAAADELLGNIVVSASKDTRDKYLRALASGDKNELIGLISRGRMGGFAGATGVSATIGREFGIGGYAGLKAFKDAGRAFGLGGLSPNVGEDQARLAGRLSELDRGQLAAGVDMQSLQGNAAVQSGFEAVRRLQARAMEDNAFANMSPAEQAEEMLKRMDRLSKANPMLDNVPVWARDLGTAQQALRKLAPGQDAARLLLAGAQLTMGEMQRIGTATEMFGAGLGAVDLSALPGELQSAEANLQKMFKGAAAELKEDSTARSALSALMDAKPDVRRAIQRALKTGNLEAAQKIAADNQVKLPTLSLRQAQTVLNAYDEAVKNPSDARTFLNAYDKAVARTDAAAFYKAADDAAKEASISANSLTAAGRTREAGMVRKMANARAGLAAAMLSNEPDEAKRKAAIGAAWDNVQKEVMSQATELAGMKDDDARGQMLAVMTPEVQSATSRLMGARGQLSRIHERQMSVEDLVKRGFSREAVARWAKDGMVRLSGETKEAIAQAEGKLSGEKAHLGRTEAQIQANKDEQVIATMKTIAEAVISSSKASYKTKVAMLTKVRGGKASPGEVVDILGPEP